MIGMRVGGNEKIDPLDPETVQGTDNVAAPVCVAGIDDNHPVFEEDDRTVTLPDIEKVCPQVAGCSLPEGGVGTVAKDTGEYSRAEQCKDQDADREDCCP
jgi:hypothetical protein